MAFIFKIGLKQCLENLDVSILAMQVFPDCPPLSWSPKKTQLHEKGAE